MHFSIFQERAMIQYGQVMVLTQFVIEIGGSMSVNKLCTETVK